MKKLTIYLLLVFFICFNISLLNIAYAQPIVMSSATAIGASNSATVSKPSGTVLNDLLVAGISIEKGNAVTITPPSGWTLILRTDETSNIGLATYFKVAGSSEPANYTFTLDNTPKWSAGITRIDNANPSTPINISAGNSSSSSSTSVVAPSITTTEAYTLVLAYYVSKKAATYTAASGTTEQYDVPNTADGQPSNTMAWYVHTTASATGTKTATASEAEVWVAQQLAIAVDLALPISLVSFSGHVNGSKISIFWKTATERNNDYMAIERSSAGNEFNEIGRVKGAGNSDLPVYYNFTDESPLQGNNYYRLKQVDFDTRYDYSRIIKLQFNKTSVKLHADRFSHKLILFGDISSYTFFSIQEISGRVIRKGNLANSNIDMDGINSGIYVLSLFAKNEHAYHLLFHK